MRSAACARTDAPQDFVGLLDYAYQGMQSGKVAEGLGTLYLGLYGHRRSLPAQEWWRLATWARTTHLLKSFIYQSPFAARAFQKPRGYAGDAELLDLIYGESPGASITDLGTEIYHWEWRSPGCRGVRARRDLLAQTMDLLPTLVPRPRILSIACGHLREALLSQAVRDGAIGELVAVDQDEESLRVVQEYSFPGLTVQQRSVKDLLLARNSYSDFDFVYAAGLCDYLPDNVARALTSAMFGMLKPGGRCLIANFAPDMLDIGYMDTFMDWRLIYRTETDVAALTEQLPESAVLSRRVFREPNDCIVFGEIVRG